LDSKIIKIGTRDSQLALWQAEQVQNSLQQLGYRTQLIAVKSEGDINLTQPLYEMGITGIFTKALDVAMLTGQIDIAVHSMKDVPTSLPTGLVEGAVLPRASFRDILVHKGLDFLNSEGIVASSSLRRRAQWLHKYPQHQMTDMRGNVNTRLQKLNDNSWNGAVFAEAGLARLGLLENNKVKSSSFEGDYELLHWMLPAPAQGAMLVMCIENDDFSRKAVAQLNDLDTQFAVHIEREFLRTLEGGCTAPIGALAEINGKDVHFKGALFSLDGNEKIYVEKQVPLTEAEDLGKHCAQEILSNGGEQIMEQLR